MVVHLIYVQRCRNDVRSLYEELLSLRCPLLRLSYGCSEFNGGYEPRNIGEQVDAHEYGESGDSGERGGERRRLVTGLPGLLGLSACPRERHDTQILRRPI